MQLLTPEKAEEHRGDKGQPTRRSFNKFKLSSSANKDATTVKQTLTDNYS